MNKKTIQAFIVPALCSVIPCLFRIELLRRPEIWIAYAIGVALILSQPSASYMPGTTFYKSTSDRNSAWTIMVVIYAVAFIAVGCYLWHPATSKSWQHILGLVLGSVVGLLGIGIRVISIRTLGRMFTTTVQVVDDHRLITHGIYQRVRHPSYAGAVLAFVALPVLFSLWWFVPVSLAAMIAAYFYRIQIEESLLLKHFPEEYAAYRHRTAALLPFLF